MIFKEMDSKGYFSNDFSLPVNELPQDWDGTFVDLFKTIKKSVHCLSQDFRSSWKGMSFCVEWKYCRHEPLKITEIIFS